MPCPSVLIIEDDLAIRDSLKMAIELEGYEVYTAPNAREGIDLFDKIPQPCVILLDLMMPVMDGFEFLNLRKFTETLSRVPVVIVSAFLDKAKDLKAEGFVQKPVSLDDLFLNLKRHCG